MKEISRIPKPIKKKASMGMGEQNIHMQTAQTLRASLKRLPRNTEHSKGANDLQPKPMVSSLVMGRRTPTQKLILYDSTCNQNDIISMMESSLMRENQNLKQQNNFLVSQVKTLFEKEKRFIQALKNAKIQNKELATINEKLEQQLYFITKNTLEEIERIQKLIKNEKIVIYDEQVFSQASDVHKSDTPGWETQATINHTLEQLKLKVNTFMDHPNKAAIITQEKETRQNLKSSKYSQRSYADEADQSGTSQTLDINGNSNRNLDCYLPDARDSNFRNSAAGRIRKG